MASVQDHLCITARLLDHTLEAYDPSFGLCSATDEILLAMQSQQNSPGSACSQSPGPGPGWAPPRAPLPPYRLAKLANALGVSTPLPAMTSSASLSSLSQTHLGNSPSASNTDLPWRSLTPSTATALNLVSPVQSKYLLHVIPPVHLLHEADTSDSTELAPPPSTASGYHTQFRRGTLVALQSTLHAQLVVIAREYALPSTMGVVLYLVTASSQSRQNGPMPFSSPSFGDTRGGEAGPRLSEEIWKYIWTRVLRAEREEVIALSRSGTPNPLGLGLNIEPNGPSQSLRPLVTPTRTEQPRPLACPITPSSTSTASSVSDIRSAEKSADASSPHSEPVTPDTSRSSDHGPPDIELPGLNSPSIIPILAKVEFDIDRRKATWYEPWARSRRMKRAESRSTHRSDSRSRTLDSSSSADEKRAPYDLKLVKRLQKPPFLRSQDDSDEEEQLNNGEYAPLSELPDADADARMTSTMERDPLGDIFGTDAETWSEIHADSDGVRRKVNNPNVVELALDATLLAALPGQRQEDGSEGNDVDEVRDIMQRMSRPPLNVSIPDSAEPKRRSTPSTAFGKRPMPPPLVLVPKSPTNDLIEGTSDGVDFRNKEGSSLELEQEYQRSRSPGEEKRVGTVFEDLDLGLDLGDDDEEYDENDPNDRRRSQYLMKAKLDEIERTLAQFSPQQLKTANLDVDAVITHHNLSAASQSRAAAPSDVSASPLHNVWPSVPYASVTKTVNGSPPRPANLPPSPPRLALNGVSTSAPKAFMATSGPSSTVPTESQIRRRELEQAMYPTATPSHSRQINFASDSPIPLSSDPFGRHPSVYELDAAPVQSYWDPIAQKLSHDPLSSGPSMSPIDDGSGAFTSATPSSRFSADSWNAVDLEDKTTKTTAPLVSVKGLKKLWRRSKSSSSTLPQPPTPGRSSFQLPSSPLPSTPTDQFMAPPVPRGSNGKVHAGQLQSDQELPYALYPSRPSLSGSRPNSPAVLLNTPPPEKPGIRKSILKSWKSVAGTGTQQPTYGSEPWKSSERHVSNETIKPRRPSILDGSIPPSPRLPEQYHPSNHVRTGSNFIERRKSAARSKMGPGHHYSSGSHDLLSTIPPARSSVVMQIPGSASSSQSLFSALSRDSESQASLETSSQFEIVSPPKVHPNLTYPYMTLDHE